MAWASCACCGPSCFGRLSGCTDLPEHVACNDRLPLNCCDLMLCCHYVACGDYNGISFLLSSCLCLLGSCHVKQKQRASCASAQRPASGHKYAKSTPKPIKSKNVFFERWRMGPRQNAQSRRLKDPLQNDTVVPDKLQDVLTMSMFNKRDWVNCAPQSSPTCPGGVYKHSILCTFVGRARTREILLHSQPWFCKPLRAAPTGQSPATFGLDALKTP